MERKTGSPEASNALTDVVKDDVNSAKDRKKKSINWWRGVLRGRFTSLSEKGEGYATSDGEQDRGEYGGMEKHDFHSRRERFFKRFFQRFVTLGEASQKTESDYNHMTDEEETEASDDDAARSTSREVYEDEEDSGLYQVFQGEVSVPHDYDARTDEETENTKPTEWWSNINSQPDVVVDRKEVDPYTGENNKKSVPLGEEYKAPTTTLDRDYGDRSVESDDFVGESGTYRLGADDVLPDTLRSTPGLSTEYGKKEVAERQYTPADTIKKIEESEKKSRKEVRRLRRYVKRLRNTAQHLQAAVERQPRLLRREIQRSQYRAKELRQPLANVVKKETQTTDAPRGRTRQYEAAPNKAPHTVMPFLRPQNREVQSARSPVIEKAQHFVREMEKGYKKETPQEILHHIEKITTENVPIEAAYERRHEVKDEPGMISSKNESKAMSGSAGGGINEQIADSVRKTQETSIETQGMVDRIMKNAQYKHAVQGGLVGAVVLLVLALIALIYRG